MGVGGLYSLLKPRQVLSWFRTIFPKPLLWEWEDDIPSSNHGGPPFLTQDHIPRLTAVVYEADIPSLHNSLPLYTYTFTRTSNQILTHKITYSKNKPTNLGFAKFYLNLIIRLILQFPPTHHFLFLSNH